MNFYFGRPSPPRKAPCTVRRLLVRCPATSRLIATGETVDEPLWAAIPTKTGKVTCPHCHKAHSWVKGDVILAR
ncbi:MAG TPA: hypothetical protein VGI60_14680 [Chthoniobacterales bacterium]